MAPIDASSVSDGVNSTDALRADIAVGLHCVPCEY